METRELPRESPPPAASQRPQQPLPPRPAQPPRTRRRGPGPMGFANVTASAVLCVVWLWVPVALFATGIGGLFALGAGLIALAAWFFLQRAINAGERVRAEAVYGLGLPVPRPRRSARDGFPGFLEDQWFVLASAPFWRGTAHHLLKQLYGGAVGILFLLAVGTGAYLLCGALNPGLRGSLGTDASAWARLAAGTGGAALFLTAWPVVWFSAWLDRLIDRWLLRPARAAELEKEVHTLDRARTGAIDSATTERLRIERDLHDGVQPMLVALSMKLGMAKAKLASDPDGAAVLVAEAHADSKQAITELRQLARGIHPAVLTDRGLDPAVSALAARSVIPVEVDVAVSGPVGAEAESVAYFVVAEALTNANKHSGAARIRVAISEHAGLLTVSIADDGRGGARIGGSASASGLAGLAGRVAAARGTLTLTSPEGGPTAIVAEVPCAS
ncbi:histidine kinase [Brevibacterium sp. BRM-1]|uniref:sensor histidine kinase n=1 Tax=Brevibacterium sp. BRM-1 TaxID=2999062 RepID=UPI0022801E2B|nr:histidine kinase [Brevibacterium sp. BRM-1]WAL39331.1 histidine kinase [Brevibacterium sp. BRM-1]